MIWPRATRLVDAPVGPARIDAQRSIALGQFERLLVYWGMTTIGLYAISWIIPTMWLANVRTAYLISGVSWCLFAYPMTKYSFRLSFPVVMALIIQLWSFFTMIHGWYVIGRPQTLGRPELYILEYLIPFFLAAAMVYIEPKSRVWILRMIFAVFTISCIVAFLQFMRVPPALALSKHYTYKTIDNWDSIGGGLRAVGLTWHPRVIAIQAIFCLALVASTVLSRKLTRLELFALFFYSGIVIFSQARMIYFVLIVVWIAFLAFLLSKDRGLVLKLILAGVACILFVFTVAPNRLAYATQSSSLEEDASYKHRAQNNWAQADRIYEAFPMTGIGPDQVLMLGGRSDPFDKWTNGMIMESGYRLFLAMYGVPGLTLLIVCFGGSLILTLLLFLSPGESLMRRRVAGVGFAAVAVVMLNCYASNTVDEYMSMPLSFMIAGMLLRTRQEEQDWVQTKTLGTRAAEQKG
jgi:hypothetical protein